MKPERLLIIRNGPDDILLPAYIIKNGKDWIPSHIRAKYRGASIHNNLHNDEVHGVKNDDQQSRPTERTTAGA